MSVTPLSAAASAASTSRRGRGVDRLLGGLDVGPADEDPQRVEPGAPGPGEVPPGGGGVVGDEPVHAVSAGQ